MEGLVFIRIPQGSASDTKRVSETDESLGNDKLVVSVKMRPGDEASGYCDSGKGRWWLLSH
jgi:hypothetical protein